MQIYKVFDTASSEARPHFSGSLNEAHIHAKFIASRADARIELAEIPTDKAAVLLFMNGQASEIDFVPLRTWSLTARGGLNEISNGD